MSGIQAQPVAAPEVEQQEEGSKPQRNDRFLLRPESDKTVRDDVPMPRLKAELENFFRGLFRGSGTDLTFLGWKNAQAALRH